MSSLFINFFIFFFKVFDDVSLSLLSFKYLKKIDTNFYFIFLQIFFSILLVNLWTSNKYPLQNCKGYL
jgi:hypothetical protein